MDQINFVTKEAYQGGNQELLQSQKAQGNFKSNEWGTYIQFKEKGRKVSHGQKGLRLKKVVDDIDEKTGKKEFGVRFFHVFNLDQTELINK